MHPPKTALLVEDNHALAESIAFALSTYGWTVMGPFKTVGETLSAIEGADFDVAILDIELGDETSEAIAVRLREVGRPFLFMSGYESFDRVPEEFRNETQLPKPVELDELTRELARLVNIDA